MTDTPLAQIKVQELLREVRVDYARSRIVDAAVAAVTDILLSLPEKQVSGSLVSAFARDLGVADDKAQLKFVRPEGVETVGSYGTKTVAKPVQQVDLAVRLPKSCFHEKDYLNHRYHVKRALYLVVLKKALAKCAAISSIKWSTFCDDARKPVLLLFPAPDAKGATTKSIIRLLPTISSETFSVNKLGPTKNNVRSAVSPDGVAQHTPHYNSSILEDMSIESTASVLREALIGNEAMRDAVLLLKVWSRQRGIYDAADSLNGFLSTVLIAYLASPAGGKRINEYMTALQVFRLTMESIANGNVLEKGIFMQGAGLGSVGAETKKALQQAFKVVISGSQVWVNFASRMSKSAAAELKGEALRTLAAMKISNDEGFNASFMTKIDFAAKFDYHVRVKLSEDRPSPSPRFLDEDNFRLYEQQLESLLIRGLGDRAQLVRVVRRSCNSGWALKEGPLKLGKGDVWTGISLINLDAALRMADVGPSADNKEEAKKFRAFWGSRAELRRFKDGNISETAVWECEGWQRHLIIQWIIQHVLHRHLSLAPESLHIVSGQLDFALLEKGSDPTSTVSKLMEVIGNLSKRLRDIEDLPLKVVSVQPISPAFSHADVFPPQPHPLAEKTGSQKIPTEVPVYVDPLEIMLQLEGSGNWPEAPVAIKKTKAAFCLQIAQSLQKKYGVGCIAAEDAVDIIMEGYVFRLVLMYDKDPTRAMTSKDDEQLGTVSPAHDLLLRSSHSSLIQGLYGSHIAFGPSVRLAKRWIWSHFFSDALTDEVIELLVAYVFVHPYPHLPPTSRVTGFLRFLRLLINHEWALEPLVVDVNGDLTPNDYIKIMAKFDAARHGPQIVGAGPEDIRGPSMYISTSYDFGCKTWTHESPSQQVLKRLIAYAKSSANLLSELVKGNDDDRKWLSIFRTPVSGYDVLLELHPECLPHPNRVLFPPEGLGKSILSKSAPKLSPWMSPSILKMGIKAARDHIIIGLNPVEEFVQDLKAKYNDSCTIWYDPVGSSLMGLTLSNTAFSAKGKSAKRKRVENEQSIFNLDTFLMDVASIGEGLVKSIYLSPARRKDM
ncbi:hypothetical protein KC19_VG060900 [Ceratodon purpureus]|uniref:Nucleolar protein 6 n=1 Tax=Ceratodon purpureus TaxID=3225 RepID=A0A8T0HMG9_CERPU|nr:hypothetical protein KC19_VG060900 [Ceratodon purpureus]